MARLETIKEKVINAIKDQFSIDEKKVYPTDRLNEDLGMDSIDAVEMVMAIEVELQIDIPYEDAEKWKTVQDVIDYAQEKPVSGRGE